MGASRECELIQSIRCTLLILEISHEYWMLHCDLHWAYCFHFQAFGLLFSLSGILQGWTVHCWSAGSWLLQRWTPAKTGWKIEACTRTLAFVIFIKSQIVPWHRLLMLYSVEHISYRKSSRFFKSYIECASAHNNVLVKGCLICLIYRHYLQ